MRLKSCIVIALMVGVHGESAARTPPTPAKPFAIIREVPVAGAGNAIRASVKGHSGLFLFDTGEGVSTVTPEYARAIGCRPWGQVTGFRMSGERLDFQRCDGVRFDAAGQRLEAPIAGVFDIMSLLPDSTTQLSGSLGLDVFAGRKITIEPKSNQIVVESPKSFAQRIADARRLSSRIVRDAEGVALALDVGVPTKLGTAWMELDTGNGGTLVIGKHVAEVLGLDPKLTPPQRAHFELTDGIAVTGDARVRDLIMDGNIGERFWSNWNVTLDLATGGVWISPISRPVH